MHLLLTENRRLQDELDRIRRSPVYPLVRHYEALGKYLKTLGLVLGSLNRFAQPYSKKELERDLRLVAESRLFDAEFYCRQLGKLGLSTRQPLRHYLAQGWRLGVKPSPYFEPKFVFGQLEDEENEGRCPLVVFVERWRSEKLSPNILFDTARYLNFYDEGLAQAVDPVTHFLGLRDKNAVELSLLFDSRFYLQKYSDVADSGLDPWSHYMKIGRFELRMPNPVFHPRFYQTQILDVQDDAVELLAHYCEKGSRQGLSPHPAFDPAYYQSMLEGDPLKRSSVEHFLKTGRFEGRLGNEFLDAEFRASKAGEPEKHRFLQQTYCHELSLSNWLSIERFRTSSRKGIIFVGHEASMTGAPMVLLSIVKSFARDGYECFVLMKRGGELIEEYQRHSTVIRCDASQDSEYIARVFLDIITPLIHEGRIAGALTNTAEVLAIQSLLKEYGLPVVSLIHELADCYSREYWKKLYNSSDHMVFSSQLNLESARKNCPPPQRLKLHVKAQGLLDSGFGVSSRDAARDKIRSELKVGKDAFIVLGCGSVDMRKGIDMFVHVAQESLKQHDIEEGREKFFVWIGTGAEQIGSPFYYAAWDIQQMGLDRHVKILPPLKDIEPWFSGADVFILPSRQDPLPCVVHNAMACETPVIAFKKSGGTQELIGEGGGKLVDYGDVGAIVDAIRTYYLNEDERLRDGKAGREIAKANWSFSEYYAYLGELIDREVFAANLVECREQSAARNLDSKIEFLEKRLRNLLDSPSWRCTAGLRVVRKVLRRNRVQSAEQDAISVVRKQRLSSSRQLYADYLRNQIAGIRNSFSWQLARPVRALDRSARKQGLAVKNK